MRSSDTVKGRLKKLYIFTIMIFWVLFVVLFNVQVINHNNLSNMADNQYNAIIKSENIRGHIVDKNGISLTKGRDRVYLIVFSQLLPSRSSV